MRLVVSAGLGLKFIFKQGGRTNRCPASQGVEGVQGDTPLGAHRQHATAMACETLAGVESPNLNDFCRSTRGSYRSNPYRLLRSHYNYPLLVRIILYQAAEHRGIIPAQENCKHMGMHEGSEGLAGGESRT